MDRRRLTRRVRLGAGLGSILGFAAAAAAAASLSSRPEPGQVPGYATLHGFDPDTDVVRLLMLAGFPLLGGAVGMWLGSRRRGRPVQAAATARTAPQRPRSETAWPAWNGLALSAVAAHVIAVWTFLAVPFGSRGVPPAVSLIGLAAVSLGLVALLGKRDLGRGARFLAAACPILPFTLLGPRSPAYWLAVGAAGLLLPVLARAASGLVPRLERVLRVLLVWGLLPGSVTGFVAAASFRAPIVGDVFEDGHGLLPASEYKNGEMPYRDIVPGHGLVSDGLFQLGLLEVFGDDYLGIKRGTKVVGLAFLPALYALGWAASGRAAVGFGGLLLTLILLPSYLFLRALLSIWTMVLAIYAARSKSPGAWIACGAALPVGLCIAVDFTAYAAASVAVALWVARGNRRDHLLRVLVGAAVSAGAIALALARFGILDDFVRTTFVFVPALLPVYALGFPPFELPPEVVPGVGAWLRSQTALAYLFLAISAVVSGALLPRAPRVGARARGLLPVLAWIGTGMLSVIERHHVTYPLLVAPVGLLLLVRWARGWGSWTRIGALAPVLLLATLVLGREPVSFVSGVGRGLIEPWTPPGVRAVEGVPRSRGAVFHPGDANLIEATSAMIRDANLRPDETWLDFANAPALYYLFDRDCPIRYYEVPFYETEEAQREVIAAVASNPRVRMALVHSGLLAQTIDDIGSAERAPLVAAFLRENFRPFSKPGAVEFWIRKDGAALSPEGREAR